MERDELPNILKIKVDRHLYEKDQLRQELHYAQPDKKLWTECCEDRPNLKQLISKTVPAIEWLPRYQWGTDLVGDLVSGFTVAIMHIPQGMAYALLGNVPPVVGLYMAFFPVLTYFFLGTSRHVSMGTFSIACLMTGKAVLAHSDPFYLRDIDSLNNTTSEDIAVTGNGLTPIQVACVVSLASALVQLVMYFLRLGAVSALLSETLVNAFTAGAAVQVVCTQLKDLLGLKLPRSKGYFDLYYTFTAIIDNIGDLNYAALLISAIYIIIISLNNEILKPIISKHTTIPVPIELIAVVSGTLICRYFNLSENYNIRTVGDIPTGFPVPALPEITLLPSVFVDGISIAIVSYVISLSLALMLAQRANYEVDANQELLAMGASNIVGSLFSCMPVCGSLSRSLIQQVVGGRTQLVSVVSCALLVFILLWIAPFFELLPRSVLASIIVVSLKGLLIQIGDVVKIWKQSKLDGLLWILTFLTVIFVGMDIGLLVGFAMSLVTIFILSFKPYTCLLGSVPHTDIYLDVNRYKGTKEIDGIKIFHYCGGLSFATKTIFRDELYKLVDLNPQRQLIFREKLVRTEKKMLDDQKNGYEEKIKKLHARINSTLKCLIADFSSVSYVDPSAVSMLDSVIKDYRKLGISFLVAGCSDNVYNTMERCGLIAKEKLPGCIRTFQSVHDAVQYATYSLGTESDVSIVRIT